MTLSLPDTAVAGDSGHVADHNLFTVALGTVDTHLTATTDHIPAGAVALGDVAATYTDESVGRRIFTWDTVNSRWQMTYGDTGWRDVTALLQNGWTGGYVHMRRIGQLVEIAGGGLDKASSSGDAFITPGSGFRSTLYSGNDGAMSHGFDSAGAPVALYCFSSDSRVCAERSHIGSGKTLRFTMRFTTVDAWPASLPGTAVGSIPYA